MTPNCRVQVRVVFQQQPGHALVVGIGGHFLAVDRAGPAVLPSGNGLLIPVGTFHQAHGDGGAPVFGPNHQVFQIVVAVPQVGLQGYPQVIALAKLCLHQNVFENGEGQGLVAVLLHVKVDGDPELLGAAQQGTNMLADLDPAALGIQRIKLRVEGGQLNGYLHLGQRFTVG